MRFIKLREEHLEQVLKWRTSEHVTKYMYTDIEDNLEKQKQWFAKVKQDTNSKYWVIEFKDQLIGLVSLHEIDMQNKRATWAYYIGEPAYSMVGPMIGPYLYNYVFSELGLKKLMGEVMSQNENVRKTHKMHGCREVGYYKDHIYKYGEWHDVYLYEMLAKDWQQQQKKYKRYQGEFE
ncbi:UDP-4-amino-4,6-dideoxy-N-acetyl-beta-L-altrosamine N-acetyltransferase [Bacillus tianshenii]|nr:UDP-4-amino-4,6-dideoxy-N-acetyl-beta-L-altrosamine N-acetyltransferase [Bacillus tianshenii]